MSFDIIFQPCRYATTSFEEKNPLKASVRSSLPNEALADAELQCVESVLKKAQAHAPDENGCYVIELGDGGEAEIFGSDLANGCMVTLRGMTPDLLQFLYELLAAGKWVMLPTMEDTVAITTSPENIFGIPDDFPKIVVCNSAKELGVLLRDGVQGWAKYRDQIVDN